MYKKEISKQKTGEFSVSVTYGQQRFVAVNAHSVELTVTIRRKYGTKSEKNKEWKRQVLVDVTDESNDERLLCDETLHEHARYIFTRDDTLFYRKQDAFDYARTHRNGEKTKLKEEHKKIVELTRYFSEKKGAEKNERPDARRPGHKLQPPPDDGRRKPRAMKMNVLKPFPKQEEEA